MFHNHDFVNDTQAKMDKFVWQRNCHFIYLESNSFFKLIEHENLHEAVENVRGVTVQTLPELSVCICLSYWYVFLQIYEIYL